MSTTRINELPAAAGVASNDYLAIDNTSGVSQKITAAQLVHVDNTLSVAGRPADAKATGDAISAEASARAQAISEEAAARESVGTEVDELKSALKLYGISYVEADTVKQSSVYGAVEYRYNSDGSYTVIGTQTQTTYKNISETGILPESIEKGATYFFNFSSNNVGFDVVCDGNIIINGAKKPWFFTVPANANSLYFRISTWNASNWNETVMPPIVSKLTDNVGNIIIFPEFYGEQNNTAPYSTINKALELSNCIITSGIYNIAKTITFPENRKLAGCGTEKTIINYTPETGNAILCSTGGESIENLTINGGLTARPNVYGTAHNKNGIVIENEVNGPCRIKDINITGFSKNGILVTNRGYTSLLSVIIDSVLCKFNGAGITFYEKGEYGVLLNSISIDNYFGAIDSGGNNKIANCGFDRNVYGLYASAVQNDTHSDVIGSSFNHCIECGLQIDGIQSMLTFTGCNLFGNGVQDLNILNSQAVSLVNCLFGLNAKIFASKGSKANNIYKISDCLFGNTPDHITVSSGTLMVIANCYTQNGAVVQ